MNVDATFRKIWFGIASATQELPHLVMPLILPNWANSQFGSNHLPLAGHAITAAAQASV
jgi:hypothetical protein